MYWLFRVRRFCSTWFGSHGSSKGRESWFSNQLQPLSLEQVSPGVGPTSWNWNWEQIQMYWSSLWGQRFLENVGLLAVFLLLSFVILQLHGADSAVWTQIISSTVSQPPPPSRPPTSPEPQWFPERRQKYTLSDQIKLCEGHVGGQRQWWTDCKLTPASPSLTTSSIYLDVTTAYSKRKLQFLNSLRHHAGVEAQNISHIILWRHTHCKKQWTCS